MMIRFMIATVLASALAMPAWSAQRIKELASISGVRNNQLVGYGVVVGLDGTGDKSGGPAAQSMMNLINKLGVQMPPGQRIDSKNSAAVVVTANLPPFAKPGQPLDVTISSISDAKSLRGGTLLMTPLKGADGQVYAMAQGNVLIGGAGASAGGSSVTVNQLNAGRIPGGATVEREVMSSLYNGDSIQLELFEADFTTANRVVEAINRNFGQETARALDGRVIEVRAPFDSNQRVRFLARMENLAVTAAESTPLVILNARTGSVVMNQAVKVEPCAVAHGNLSVTVNSTPVVSQPNPLSQGQTVVGQEADISVQADGSKIINVPRGTNLNQVVRALNAVGATPQDLLSILQAMKAAGALKADLQII